jgi:hypothetical protein
MYHPLLHDLASWGYVVAASRACNLGYLFCLLSYLFCISPMHELVSWGYVVRCVFFLYFLCFIFH